jgi:hypothetical protein
MVPENETNLLLLPNGKFLTRYQPFLRFFCPTSAQKTPLSIIIENSRWRGKLIESIFVETNNFYKMVHILANTIFPIGKR